MHNDAAHAHHAVVHRVHMQFDGTGAGLLASTTKRSDGIAAAQLHECGSGLDHRQDRTHIRVGHGDLVGDPVGGNRVGDGQAECETGDNGKTADTACFINNSRR